MWFTVQNLQDPKQKLRHLLPFCPQWHHGSEMQQQKKHKKPCEGYEAGVEGKCERRLHGKVTAFFKVWCFLGKNNSNIIHFPLFSSRFLFFSSMLIVKYQRTLQHSPNFEWQSARSGLCYWCQHNINDKRWSSDGNTGHSRWSQWTGWEQKNAVYSHRRWTS